jgi:DNA polymerase V
MAVHDAPEYAEGITKSWGMKREHLSPAYTTNWKELPIVK